jgi:hypothetical protein
MGKMLILRHFQNFYLIFCRFLVAKFENFTFKAEVAPVQLEQTEG